MAVQEAGTTVTLRRAAVWAGVALLAWSGDAMVAMIQYRTMMSQQDGPMPPWTDLLPTTVASSLLWVPFTVMILWLTFRWPITAARRNVLVHAGGLAVVVVGRALAVILLNRWVGWYPAEVPDWSALLVTSLFNNIILFVLVTGFAHAAFYLRAARSAEARFTAARLEALTSQLRPHFLFNALNTVAAHVHDRPDVADRMIVDLSALLRSSIDRDSRGLVPLADELEIGAAYLKIEEHRFEDRLRVEIVVDPAVRDASVPPFLLQPLLENAVRHGLAPSAGRRTLGIHAALASGVVRIEVTDDGEGLTAQSSASEGIGLANVRARLTEVFGAHASLTLSSRAGAGTVATIQVPYRPVALQVRP